MTNLCVQNDRRLRRIGWLLLFMLTAFSVASVKHEWELTRITRGVDPFRVAAGSWRHMDSICQSLTQAKLDALLLGQPLTSKDKCTPLMPAAKGDKGGG